MRLYRQNKLKLFICYINIAVLLLPTVLYAHDACNMCHLASEPRENNAELAGFLPGLCIYCHDEKAGVGEHAINIVPTGTTGGLPTVNGLLGCTSCHDPHGKKPKQLWLSGDELCFSCHQF